MHRPVITAQHVEGKHYNKKYPIVCGLVCTSLKKHRHIRVYASKIDKKAIH